MKKLDESQIEEALSRLEGIKTSVEMMILTGIPEGNAVSGNIRIYYEISY